MHPEVVSWFEEHADTLGYAPIDASTDLVRVGTTEVRLPRSVSEQGLAVTREFLRNAVHQAWIAKAEAHETAAASLRSAARSGVVLPG